MAANVNNQSAEYNPQMQGQGSSSSKGDKDSDKESQKEEEQKVEDTYQPPEISKDGQNIIVGQLKAVDSSSGFNMSSNLSNVLQPALSTDELDNVHVRQNQAISENMDSKSTHENQGKLIN